MHRKTRAFWLSLALGAQWLTPASATPVYAVNSSAELRINIGGGGDFNDLGFVTTSVKYESSAQVSKDGGILVVVNDETNDKTANMPPFGDLIDTAGSLNALVFNSDSGIVSYAPSLAVSTEGAGSAVAQHTGDKKSVKVSAELNGKANRPGESFANSRVRWNVAIALKNLSQEMLSLEWIFGWSFALSATSDFGDEDAYASSSAVFDAYSLCAGQLTQKCSFIDPLVKKDYAEDDSRPTPPPEFGLISYTFDLEPGDIGVASLALAASGRAQVIPIPASALLLSGGLLALVFTGYRRG